MDRADTFSIFRLSPHRKKSITRANFNQTKKKLSSIRISEAQKAVFELHDRICRQNNQTWPPTVTVVDILEEAGEVADVVKNLEGYSPHQRPYTKEKLAAELADLTWSVLLLAASYDLSLESAVREMLARYEARFLKD